ncbi:MAG: phosphatidylglycerophosphatase A [Pyrinomonadaceae bacterium]|nr:phosphatidylglycerophosphatase A [Pyrinomonadaceae bacterium]
MSDEIRAAVKESSDELNPSVVTIAPIAAPPRRRSVKDTIAFSVATCGVGLLPLAPGTWGSLVGVFLWSSALAMSERIYLFATARGWTGLQAESLYTTLAIFALAALTFVGTWAASRVEPLIGRKDPGVVVIDEVVGQLIAFIFVPRSAGVWTLVAGFSLFRLFDIWKPYPIRRLEVLESGLGIMADDVLAGIYAAAVMSLLVFISSFAG